MKSEGLLARQNLAWIINGYNRLWKIILNWHDCTRASVTESTTPIFLQFLQSLRTYSEQEMSQPDLLGSDIELSQIWLRCVSDVMKLNDFSQMHPLQAGLSPFILYITEASKDSKMFECLESTFFPTVIDTKKSLVFESFNLAFKVFLKQLFIESLRLIQI